MKDGDSISIDLLGGTIDWEPSGEKELGGSFGPYKGERIYLRGFANSVSQAGRGCVNKSIIS